MVYVFLTPLTVASTTKMSVPEATVCGSMIKWFVVPVTSTVAPASTDVPSDRRKGFDEELLTAAFSVHVEPENVPEYFTP